MAEYIEREALIEDINETVVFTVREGVHLPTSEMRGANKVIDRIKSAPTADVVEIVRCKDCRFFINRNGISWCEEHSEDWRGHTVYVDEDDFCSCGERKGD